MVDDEELEHRLAVFHHEAATPVALIVAALNTLDHQQVVGPDAAELLDMALRQAQVLQRLLDQLRGVGRDELVFDATRIDLAGLAGQIVTDLEATILQGRDCRVDVPDGPVPVDGDAILLRQVLTNLLDNAVKFTGAATTIRVAVARAGGHVELAVTDEGEGIAPEDLQRIFRRFERADTRSEGLGLGLYLVWLIVDSHGGHVTAQPAPEGRGARFVVRLPAAAGHEPSVTPG